MNYLDFLERKRIDVATLAAPIKAKPHPNAKPHQSDCLEFLLQIGRGAAFLDTGLGKTFLQLDWARHIPGKVLIVAPLAVAQQTLNEAKRLLDLDITYSSDGKVKSDITITNYDRLHNFDSYQFEGVVLDESSILKGKNSKTKGQLIEMFSETPYRLACTATPAPNDYTELGNHAEFLGIMNTQEMLTRWFIHDSANTGDWRLKGHAVKPFWEWVSSWAACVSKPSDLGHSNEGYDLPPLKIKTHTVESPLKEAEGMLFDIPSINATELHASKRATIHQRCGLVAEMVNRDAALCKPWIVWCESNQESETLAALIPDAVEVKGADTIESKERKLMAFTNGDARVIISKPSICGFGMNWQHCRNIAFASISYSYEKFYQAIRRSWRFGQTEKVHIEVVLSDAELPVWRSVESKATNHQSLKDHMRFAVFKSNASSNVKVEYNPKMEVNLPSFLTEKHDEIAKAKGVAS